MTRESKLDLFRAELTQLCESGVKLTLDEHVVVEAKHAPHAGSNRIDLARADALAEGYRSLIADAVMLAKQAEQNYGLSRARLADELQMSLKEAFAQVRHSSRIEQHDPAFGGSRPHPRAVDQVRALESEMLLAVRAFRPGGSRTLSEGRPRQWWHTPVKLMKWGLKLPLRLIFRSGGL